MTSRLIHSPALLALVLLLAPWMPAQKTQPGIKKKYEPKPIPSGKDALTWPKHHTNYRAFQKKRLIDYYRKHRNTDAKWDKAVVTVLEAFQDGVVQRRHGDATWRREMIARLGKLGELGCDDPIVKYVHGSVLYFGRKFEDALALLKDVEKEVATSSHPAGFSFLVSRRLFYVHKRLGNKEQVNVYNDRLYGEFIRSAADRAYKNGNQRYWLMEMSKTWGTGDNHPGILTQTMKGLQQIKDVDPWILHVCTGIWGISHAWEARGNKYADQTTEAQFAEFHKRLAVAARHLRKAHKLQPGFPEAATAMISVAMATSGDPLEVRKWFDLAVAAQFDYMDAYRETLYAFKPRWVGNLDLMLSFGIECLRTERYDTFVPDYFGRAVWQIGNELEDLKKILNHRNIYQLLQHFIKKVAAEPSRADKKNFHLSMSVCLNYMTGRVRKAAREYRELGKDFDKESLKLFKLKEAEVLADFAKFDKNKKK